MIETILDAITNPAIDWYDVLRYIALPSFAIHLMTWALTDIFRTRVRDWDRFTWVIVCIGGAGSMYMLTLLARVLNWVGADDRRVLSVLYALLALTAFGIPDAVKNCINAYRARREGIVREAFVYDSSVPIVVADPFGTIAFATSAFYAISGHERGSLHNQNLEIIMPEEQRPLHREGMRIFRETGEGPIINRVIAVDLLRADGQQIPIFLAVHKRVANGQTWDVGYVWERAVGEAVPQELA